MSPHLQPARLMLDGCQLRHTHTHTNTHEYIHKSGSVHPSSSGRVSQNKTVAKGKSLMAHSLSQLCFYSSPSSSSPIITHTHTHTHTHRGEDRLFSAACLICLWCGQISLRRHSARRSGGAGPALQYTPGSLFPSTSGSALKQPWLQAPESSGLQPTHVRVILSSRWARHDCTHTHTLAQ